MEILLPLFIVDVIGLGDVVISSKLNSFSVNRVFVFNNLLLIKHFHLNL
jgi:hypothetical protein